MANTSLKVVVEVDPDTVRNTVNEHAAVLREEGVRELAEAIYEELVDAEKVGMDQGCPLAGRISEILMQVAGPTMMTDIVASHVVAEVREANELEGISETCPNCGSGDRLNNIIRTVGHPEEGQRCRHKFHREVDL